MNPWGCLTIPSRSLEADFHMSLEFQDQSCFELKIVQFFNTFNILSLNKSLF